MIAITGATGQLGRLVIQNLLKTVPASQIVAAVHTKDDQAGQVCELADDSAYTLAGFAAEIAKQSGQAVVYNDLAQAAYAAALVHSSAAPPRRWPMG